MTDTPDQLRSRLIPQVQTQIESERSPRLAMMLVLLASTISGFLTSVILLDLGMNSMACRYPVAIGAAYLMFLVLLGRWLRSEARRLARVSAITAESALAAAPLATLDPIAEADHEAQKAVPVSKPKGRSSWGGGGGGDADLAVLILILIALIAAFLVCLYLIALAPTLMAEMAVDGVVLASVAKSAKPPGPGAWIPSVVRRTWLPVLILGLVFSLVGLGLEHAAPGARTMGEAWTYTPHGP